MGKASTNKKVARAAKTGGGRTAGVRRPYGWYTVLGIMVALGVFLIAFSRHQQQAAAAIHPRGSDHWHAAYGIDLCGTFQPPLPQNPNLSSSTAPPGIHTHGDGLIHIEPFVSGLGADAGNNATLARFAVLYPGLRITSNLIQYPGQKAYRNGDKCGPGPSSGKAGQVRIRVWPKATGSTSITYTNPSDVHLKDGQAITVAFLPLDSDIPKPPKAALDALNKPTEGTPTTVPAAPPITAAPPTTVKTSTSPTTAAASVSPAPGSPTTSAGSPATTVSPTTSPASATTSPPTSASGTTPTSHP